MFYGVLAGYRWAPGGFSWKKRMKGSQGIAEGLRGVKRWSKGRFKRSHRVPGRHLGGSRRSLGRFRGSQEVWEGGGSGGFQRRFRRSQDISEDHDMPWNASEALITIIMPVVY